MTPKISILILTYNSERFVEKIFGSIISLVGKKIKSGEYELLVIDNNSQDDTIKSIQNFFKNHEYQFDEDSRKNEPVFIYRSPDNLGYGKGINKISKFAKGEILLVINPDAELIDEDFEKLIQEFEVNKNLAIAGLKIVGNDLKPEQTAGRFFNILSFILFSLGLENIFGLRFSPSKKQKVDFVSGGFVAFDAKKFEHLEGYDKDYFMYVEDMDICFRAHQRGFEVEFLPYGVIKHQGQGSSDRTFAIVNIYNGLQLYFKKHHGKVALFLVRCLLGLKAILIVIFSSILGKSGLRKTYSEALKTIR